MLSFTVNFQVFDDDGHLMNQKQFEVEVMLFAVGQSGEHTFMVLLK